jgi:acetylornithine deacetylase/succinyl-diaminopimelate desuccinylase family protein
MINQKRLIKLTQRLIQINSENPGGSEYSIAHFIRRYLRDLGLKAKIYEFKKRRSNIITLLKGQDNRGSLLLSPHLDTVPAGAHWRFPPFKATIHNGRIYGRGASDCKGNLAVAIEVINSLIAEGVKLDYNLVFAATADEEAGSSLGLIPLIEKGILKPNCALILDAQEYNIIIAQKGLIHLKVKIQGQKAHGAYPWQGENAIDIAMNIIKDIEKYNFRYKHHPLLRAPTVNVGTIHGGDKVNIVSDWCEFELDLRFLPGTPAGNVLKAVKNTIRRYTHKFKIEIEGVQKPYEIDKEHPLVKYLANAAKSLKIKPRISGSEGATTVTFFQKAGTPAVAFGVGSGGCAHTSDEYVTISNLYHGARILERFLKTFKF